MQRIVDCVIPGELGNHWVLSQQYPKQSALSGPAFLRLVAKYFVQLRSAGVGKERPLILICENRTENLALDLAVQQLNGSCIMLSPTMEASELRTVIGEHSPGLILYSQPFTAPVLAGTGCSHLPIDRLDEMTGDGGVKKHGVPEIISYTSGSTGRLKGVRHHHKTFLAQMRVLAGLYGFQPGKRALSVLPLNYLYERLFQYAYLYGGVSIEYASPQISPWLAILDAKFDFCATVPMILERLKETLETDHAALARLKAKPKVFFCSGAMLQASVLEFYARHGITVYEHYGSSETLIIAINGPGQHRPGTAGRLIEPEKVHLTPSSRIVFDTPLIGFTRPALHRKFKGRKRYYTGDLGEVSKDGFLKILGRTGSLIKTQQGVFFNLRHLEEKLGKISGLSDAYVFYHGHSLRIVAIRPKGGKTAPQLESLITSALNGIPGLPPVAATKMDTALCGGDRSCYTSSGKLRRNFIHNWYFPA